jgi:lipopolysaccharide transport system ATP-binding protein
MSDTVIKIKHLYKEYRLGEYGYGSLHEDLSSWWARIRGKEDPNSLVTTVHSKDAENKHFLALNNITMDILEGDIIGIIGKNGAGKSTLLKIISRITSPTGGKIKIKGRIGSLLEVGTGFHPELTGRENVYLNGTILGMKKWEINKQFDEIVYFSGVEKFLDTPVKRYSSGMIVRLGFAVAAHLQTEILIIDEVLAVGDAEFQKKAINKMGDVRSQQGKTILFVSHNMASIENLCNKVVVLENGGIAKRGNTTEGLDYYLSSRLSTEENDNLLKIIDRKGNGFAKFVKIEFKDSTNNKVNILKCGGNYQINTEIYCENNESIKNFMIGIAINDHRNNRVTVLSSDLTNQKFDNFVSNNIKIKANINRLSLVPGLYSYNLFLKINNEISDWIIDAGTFTVENGDYYLTDNIPSRHQGVFLIDHYFKKT